MTIEILPPLTEAENATAEIALARVDEYADALRMDDINTQKHFVGIGQALLAVDEDKHWMRRSFTSFSLYLKSIEDRAQKKRTQLYNCLAVAKHLLPIIPVQDLVKIGISKAMTLKKMLVAGHPPTNELIEVAKNSTDSNLKVEIAKATGLFLPESEVGQKWFELGLVRFVPEEVEMVLKTFRAVIKALEMNLDVTTWEDWDDVSPATKSEIVMAIFADCLSGAQA